MRAVLIPRFGQAADVADVVDLPDPRPPGSGQVLLGILAAPINPSDFLAFQGRFGTVPPTLPASIQDAGADVVLVDGPDLPARVAAATGGAPIRLGLER